MAQIRNENPYLNKQYTRFEACGFLLRSRWSARNIQEDTAIFTIDIANEAVNSASQDLNGGDH